jgi:hypothetical protein
MGTQKRWLVIVIIVAAAVILAILFDTSLANHQPDITSLKAEPEKVLPSGICQIVCNASDPNGDELSYEWSTTGGNIAGTGPEVTWTAPEEVGTYNITVVVEDGQGWKDTASITLIASNGPSPIIEDLIVTANGHEYLKETTTGYKVVKTMEYYIESIVSNTSGELVYEWSCDGGEISGEGSMITWTASDTEGDVIVTVEVFDSIGNWARKIVAFEVVRCEHCVDW